MADKDTSVPPSLTVTPSVPQLNLLNAFTFQKEAMQEEGTSASASSRMKPRTTGGSSSNLNSIREGYGKPPVTTSALGMLSSRLSNVGLGGGSGEGGEGVGSNVPFNPLLSSRSTRRENIAIAAGSTSNSAANTARHTHRGYLSQRTARKHQDDNILVSKSTTKLPKRLKNLSMDSITGRTPESTRSGNSTMRQRTHRSGSVGPMIEALRKLGRRLGQRFVAPDAWRILEKHTKEGIKAVFGPNETISEVSDCECPNFLISFSTKYFQSECVPSLRAAQSSTWENVLITIESIADDKFSDDVGMYAKKTARKLYGMLLEDGMKGKGSWKELSPFLKAIKYPEGTPPAHVIDAVRPLMRRLHFQEEKILRFQRRRDVLKATEQQRLQWVVSLVAIQVHRCIYAWLIADAARVEGKIGGGDYVKELLQMLVEIQTLDRGCYEGDKMYMCSRCGAFQLSRAITIGLGEGGEDVLEGLFKVDGGLVVLLDYLEAVLDDKEAEKKEVEVALECLKGLVRVGCQSEKGQGLVVAVGDIVLRSERGMLKHVLEVQRKVLESTMGSMEAVTLETHGMGLWLGFLRCCKNGGGDEKIGLYLDCLLLCARAGGLRVIMDLRMPHFISTQLSIMGKKRIVKLEEKRKEEIELRKKREEEERKAERKRKAEEAAKAASFCLGDRVDGKFEINGRDRWFAGVVLSGEGGTYRILFDDGDFKVMDIEGVRKSKNRKSPPEGSLEAIELVRGGGVYGEPAAVILEEEGGEGEEEGGEEGEVNDNLEANDDDMISMASMTDFAGGDPLDESESGIFLSIPTTLPLKPKVGAASVSKLGGAGNVGSLPRLLSLPNLPVRGGGRGGGRREGRKFSL